MSSANLAKAAAGQAVASWVESGMRVGLGTGSTTAYAIQALGARIQTEGLDVIGTPTSFAAERLAREAGIPLATLDEIHDLDLAFDGADEIDPDLHLIKGRGAAHTREKVVASLARRFVVLGDPSKQVARLGTKMPVPVEVLPMAATPVAHRLETLGGQPELRMGQKKDGPILTDQGFWVWDVTFENGIADPAELDRAIRMIPGVLDHGLFIDMATDVLIGKADGSVEHLT